MELTTQQLYILLGIALFELAGAGVIYWIASTTGHRTGRAAGYREGIETATDELEPRLHEMTTRCTSAERLLTGARNEVRRLENERDQNKRNAAEAIEELTLQLGDAQVLNDQHAILLRQSAKTLDLAAAFWRPINASLKADAALSQAQQLCDLAAWLKPQTQQMERAA